MTKLLPRGCELCLKGAKLVLFITGLCDHWCYYCPLGETRKGRDVVYADEILVEKDLDIILEGRAIDAEGTGITGGDPLIRLNRTLKYIQMLKDFFGEGHHIHLYTNGMYASRDTLARLKEAGLDEIRFHVTESNREKIRNAKILGLCTGAEVPAIPGEERQLRDLVLYLRQIGADFLNINQLEFTPQNAYQLKERGFELEGSVAAKGSEEVAQSVIQWAESEGIDLPIHYCSSSVKDKLQLRMRLLRRLKNVIRPYEEITDDGLIGKFLVTPKTVSPSELRRMLMLELGIPPHMSGVSFDGQSLVIHRKFLESVLKIYPHSREVYVKEYPTGIRERVAEIPLRY
ncbi:MAG: radical SAM protein [Candidatus Methanomethyliaceae archaeon]|nr:radical SAM protein [Candidatus Methanomethyliaceae archaeon]